MSPTRCWPSCKRISRARAAGTERCTPVAVEYTLGELAAACGSVVRGDANVRIRGVATLEHAGAGELAFLANPHYRQYLDRTRAAAVVLAPDDADACPVPALIAANPYATYARIAQVLHPEPACAAGIHPSAVIEPGAIIDATASIGAGAYVGAGARIGARTLVGPGCVILDGATLGADCRLVARVTVCRAARIGERCIFAPGAVIGADGFGHAPDKDGYVKIPQVGAVVIGNDVDVGANTTIDRGTIGDTVIEDGVKIDNLCMVAHNVRVGAHTVMAAMVGIAGSSTVGRRCMLGGQAGISGHLSICDDVALTGKTMVSRSITRPGVYSGNLPADEARSFRRNSARFQKLDELAKRVRRLEGGAPADRKDDSDE
ncbi:MAG TPA: UDP-3-O-(3-hydroxymyristoyl)glucosamine N-acyltransferase [Steroidobacteraceae bacterium]